jgi:tRNA pseudouridine38-40 synthase
MNCNVIAVTVNNSLATKFSSYCHKFGRASSCTNRCFYPKVLGTIYREERSRGKRYFFKFAIAGTSTSRIDFVKQPTPNQFACICYFGSSTDNEIESSNGCDIMQAPYDDSKGKGTSTGTIGSQRNQKRKQQWQTKKRPNNSRRSDYNDENISCEKDHDSDDNKIDINGTNNPKNNHVAWNENLTPNLGSFARIEMQSLFNVVIPSTPSQADCEEYKLGATTQLTIPTMPRSSISAKRKVIMLLGYVGTNYGGFQMNERQRTIQAELELALYRLNLISNSNFGFPTKYGWSTSGRTDKGVHACAQVISAKIEIPLAKYSTKSKDVKEKNDENVIIDLDKVRDDLNFILPHDLQIFDVVRTTRSFCAKTARDRVRYQYMIPSFLLMEPNKVRHIFETVRPNLLPIHEDQNSTTENEFLDTSGTSFLSTDEVRAVQKELYSYRVTPEQLESLQQSLSCYIGTHSFHNFSRRVKSDEARASRFIVSFDVEKPIQFDSSDDSCIEWIPTNVVGQSFLLNQIRKMICLAVDVTRGVVGKTSNEELMRKPALLIEQALQREVEMRMSQAPAQGLFLEMSYYDGYNRKIKQSNPELLQLNWANSAATVSKNSFSSVPLPSNESAGRDAKVAKQWFDFRHNVIMKHIDEEERNEGNFVSYLYNQECIFDYKSHYGLSDNKFKI